MIQIDPKSSNVAFAVINVCLSDVVSKVARC